MSSHTKWVLDKIEGSKRRFASESCGSLGASGKAAAGRSDTLSPESPPQKAFGDQQCCMLEKEENTSFASLKQ